MFPFQRENVKHSVVGFCNKSLYRNTEYSGKYYQSSTYVEFGVVSKENKSTGATLRVRESMILTLINFKKFGITFVKMRWGREKTEATSQQSEVTTATLEKTENDKLSHSFQLACNVKKNL